MMIDMQVSPFRVCTVENLRQGDTVFFSFYNNVLSLSMHSIYRYIKNLTLSLNFDSLHSSLHRLFPSLSVTLSP